jgi:hypothetical protein
MVFLTFATLSHVSMKEAGIGLATVVLLDATLVRIVLLPASMKLDRAANLAATPARPVRPLQQQGRTAPTLATPHDAADSTFRARNGPL